MMQLPCPWCGLRNVSEFHYGGEVTARPDVAAVDGAGWRQYLYTRKNIAGWTHETWYHIAGCRAFFQLERNTLTDQTRTVEGAP